MKTPPLLRNVILVGALLAMGSPLAATPREEFLAAKRTAADANYQNDKDGLRAALARFEALAPDADLGARARYHAAWCEWMLAASFYQDQKSADAVAVLDSGVARLRKNLEAQPDEAETHGLLAWMLMAIGSGDQKRFAEIAPLVREHRKRALELAPQNPRVVMLDATMLCYAPKPEMRARGFARWQETLRLLEAEKLDDATLPDWGRTLADGWLANLILTLDPARMPEARAHAEKALRERPDWWWVKTQVLPKTEPKSAG